MKSILSKISYLANTILIGQSQKMCCVYLRTANIDYYCYVVVYVRHNLVVPNFVFPHFVARIWSIPLWSTTPFGRSHFGRLTQFVEPSLVDLEKGKMGHLVDIG